MAHIKDKRGGQTPERSEGICPSCITSFVRRGVKYKVRGEGFAPAVRYISGMGVF